ncbi:MAG: hypothetical protein ABL876_14680, partial [Chitinophagaceae bacterium]
ALSDVYCVNNTVAYASGLTFWKTTDGGTTWVNLFDFGSRAAAIHFLNEMNGWAVGDFGFRKTTNGGISWQPVSIPPSTRNPVSLFIADINRGYIASGEIVDKTTDGGLNWTPILSSGNSFYHDIHFISESIGYLTDGRFVLKTTDGGTTWQKVVRLGQGFFIELHFTDANHGWAASDNGLVVRYQ